MICLGGAECVKAYGCPLGERGRGGENAIGFGFGAFKQMSVLMSVMYPVYELSGHN